MIDYQYELNTSLSLLRQRKSNYADKAIKEKNQQEKEWWFHRIAMEEKEEKGMLKFMAEKGAYDENASLTMPKISNEIEAMSVDDLLAELNA